MTQTDPQEPKQDLPSTSATRVVASTFGVLVGLAGIEHGYLEMLQGDVATSDIMINAIGEANKFWSEASERALTIIPNFLVTGILAMIFGILVTIWASAFILRKHGTLVLFLLSIIQFLVGGGFAPIILTILGCATATRINKPLLWWRTHFPVNVRGFLAKVWLWTLLAFVFVFWYGVKTQILGSSLDVTATTNLVQILGYFMVGLMLLSVLTALAHDSQKQLNL